jgi:hypothetical protein
VLASALTAVGDEMNKYAAECIRLVPVQMIETDSAGYERRFRECYDSLSAGSRPEERVKQARDSARIRNWNRAILEIGGALGWMSDSAGVPFEFHRAAVWLTGGLPVAGRNGQLLIGLRCFLRGDPHGPDALQGSAALRLYAGRSGCKGFLESDFRWEKGINPRGLLKTGGEMNVGDGIWVEASMTVTGDEREVADISHSLTIRFGTPEER